MSKYLKLINTDCILIEIDNKGSYYRYALTTAEFDERFRIPRPDIPVAVETGDSYTLRPMVHMWYMLTGVGSADWINFFADMTWGLPQADIDAENIAYVSEEDFGVLRDAWAEFNEGL